MNSKIRGDHSGEVMSNIGTIGPILLHDFSPNCS